MIASHHITLIAVHQVCLFGHHVSVVAVHHTNVILHIILIRPVMQHVTIIFLSYPSVVPVSSEFI